MHPSACPFPLRGRDGDIGKPRDTARPQPLRTLNLVEPQLPLG